MQLGILFPYQLRLEAQSTRQVVVLFTPLAHRYSTFLSSAPDSNDNEDMVGPGREERGVKQERGKKAVRHESAPTSGGLNYTNQTILSFEVWSGRTGLG